MDLFEKLLYGGAALLAVKSVKNHEENKKRRRTPCRYDTGFTKQEFEDMVRKKAKKLKRIKSISVDGPDVYCTVNSESNLSTWDFHLDFNDYGACGHACWTNSENSDSKIPGKLRELIFEGVNELEAREHNCFNCGANIVDKNAPLCPYCGVFLK